MTLKLHKGARNFFYGRCYCVSVFSIFAALKTFYFMKYSELERKLRKAGCYPIAENSHPIWYSPITGNKFQTGHHKSEEVKRGTLEKICKQAGVKF